MQDNIFHTTHVALKATVEHSVNAEESITTRSAYTLKSIEDRFIVIERDELTNETPSDAPSSAAEYHRRMAIKHLAKAEELRRSEGALDEEAAALYSSIHGDGTEPLAAWEVELLVDNFEDWRAVARKARVIHQVQS